MNKEEWQQRANQNQNEKRKGTPTFAAVRLSDENEKKWIEGIIKKFAGTKKDSLIAAYKLLEKDMKK
jgi:hypothetical protein